MQHVINLKAGVPLSLPLIGRTFFLIEQGVAASIALRFRAPGQGDEELSEVKRGFRLSLNDGAFVGVDFLAPVDTTVKIIVSNNRADYSFADGQTVTATIAGLPLSVSNDRGSPGNLVHVTGVSLADAPATSATSAAPVACGPVAAVLAAADANRRALRMCNLGPDPVAIGPAGATWAQRVIVLQAGDTWVEDRGANLAWSGITDAAKAASVTVQGVLA